MISPGPTGRLVYLDLSSHRLIFDPFGANKAIVDSGANIHLVNTAASTMATKKIKLIMAARLPDISTMASTHIEKLSLTGMYDETRKILIFPEVKIVSIILLGFLCDDG